MKKLLSILIVLSVSITLFGQNLPNKFRINEDLISIGTDFTLTNGAKGTIEQKIFSIGSNFILKINGEVIAKSVQAIISWGSKITILDGNKIKIGSIEEILATSFFSVYSKYSIYDANGKKIAISEKHDLMATSFIIKDMDGKVICNITRPMINIMTDRWDIEFTDSKFDKRLVLFIPCYKTHRDNDK